MILPAGIDKASGVRAAATRLGIGAEQVVAVGDAENDEPFLSACGLGVAVANSLPGLRKHAAFVTTRPYGEGVVELIERILHEDGGAEAAQR
jgi:hydroxymethylpyrimidine pyrophosphatase-like HAD family hydrolase